VGSSGISVSPTGSLRSERCYVFLPDGSSCGRPSRRPTSTTGTMCGRRESRAPLGSPRALVRGDSSELEPMDVGREFVSSALVGRRARRRRRDGRLRPLSDPGLESAARRASGPSLAASVGPGRRAGAPHNGPRAHPPRRAVARGPRQDELARLTRRRAPVPGRRWRALGALDLAGRCRHAPVGAARRGGGGAALRPTGRVGPKQPAHASTAEMLRNIGQTLRHYRGWRPKQ
jgi:hypothetical protein